MDRKRRKRGPRNGLLSQTNIKGSSKKIISVNLNISKIEKGGGGSVISQKSMGSDRSANSISSCIKAMGGVSGMKFGKKKKLLGA